MTDFLYFQFYYQVSCLLHRFVNIIQKFIAFFGGFLSICKYGGSSLTAKKIKSQHYDDDLKVFFFGLKSTNILLRVIFVVYSINRRRQ